MNRRVSQIAGEPTQYYDFLCEVTIPVFKSKREINLEFLKGKDFDLLSVEEKFAHCALLPEAPEKGCARARPNLEATSNEIPKQMFGRWNYYPGHEWSPRQLDFLRSHRTDVVRFLKTTIGERKRVGINLKYIISNFQLYELTPDCLAVYQRDHYDQDILAMLLSEMEREKFEPLLASDFYAKFYKTASVIPSDPENRQLVINLAKAYYKSKMNQNHIR